MVFLFINDKWDDAIKLQTAMLWVPSHGQILSLLCYSLLISEAITDCTINWLAYDSIKGRCPSERAAHFNSYNSSIVKNCKERSLTKVLYGSIIKFNFICVAMFPTITNIPVYMYIYLCMCTWYSYDIISRVGSLFLKSNWLQVTSYFQEK